MTVKVKKKGFETRMYAHSKAITVNIQGKLQNKRSGNSNFGHPEKTRNRINGIRRT